MRKAGKFVVAVLIVSLVLAALRFNSLNSDAVKQHKFQKPLQPKPSAHISPFNPSPCQLTL